MAYKGTDEDNPLKDQIFNNNFDQVPNDYVLNHPNYKNLKSNTNRKHCTNKVQEPVNSEPKTKEIYFNDVSVSKPLSLVNNVEDAVPDFPNTSMFLVDYFNLHNFDKVDNDYVNKGNIFQKQINVGNNIKAKNSTHKPIFQVDLNVSNEVDFDIVNPSFDIAKNKENFSKIVKDVFFHNDIFEGTQVG